MKPTTYYLFIVGTLTVNAAYAMDQELLYLGYHDNLGHALVKYARENNAEKVEQLLKMNPPLCYYDKGLTALGYAALNEQGAITERLAHRMNNEQYALADALVDPFRQAARINSIKALEYLMTLHLPIVMKKRGINEAFMIACSRNFLQFVARLMKQYSHDIEENSCQVAFASALHFNYKDVIKIVLQHHKTNPYEKVFDQVTSLEYAAENCDQEMVNVLKDAQHNYVLRLQNQIELLKQNTHQKQPLRAKY